MSQHDRTSRSTPSRAAQPARGTQSRPAEPRAKKPRTKKADRPGATPDRAPAPRSSAPRSSAPRRPDSKPARQDDRRTEWSSDRRNDRPAERGNDRRFERTDRRPENRFERPERTTERPDRRADRFAQRTRPERSFDRPARDSARDSARPAARETERPVAPAVERTVEVNRTDLNARLDEALLVPAPEPKTFAELGLPKPMVLALSRRDIHSPFAIQARALPDALAGKDVLGRAQTGAGKTLAFGLPMLARLAATGTPARRSGGRNAAPPRGLVLVPTRELARQVADNLVAFGHTVDLSVAMVYGGAPINKQIAALRLGVDVVVATPGRLLDLIERKALTLSGIEITVLDEADHMADMGFMPDVRRILNQTPEGGQRLLFSATLDKAVERLVREYLPDPVVHAVAPAAARVENMTHLLLQVAGPEKTAVAARIAERPARTLFFVRTKRGADTLAEKLTAAGAPALAIHGNLNQNQRQRALDAFAAGSSRVLVATDVAARGIHVDDVDLVVHYDPPVDDKAYLHRSGRTARAGTSGTVVSLVLHGEIRGVKSMLRRATIEAESFIVNPEHEEVVKLATSGEPVVVVEPVRPVKAARPRQENRPRPDGSAPYRKTFGRATKRSFRTAS